MQKMHRSYQRKINNDDYIEEKWIEAVTLIIIEDGVIQYNAKDIPNDNCQLTKPKREQKCIYLLTLIIRFMSILKL